MLLIVILVFQQIQCFANFFDSYNNQPIIGILTQPSPYNDYLNYQFLQLSYVKSLEASGFRVFPMKYTESYEILESQLKQINGLFLMGGSTQLLEKNKNQEFEYTLYTNKTRFLIQQAKLINKNKKQKQYFPVFGVCLGMESLIFAFTDEKDILQPVQGMQNHLDSINLNLQIFKS